MVIAASGMDPSPPTDNRPMTMDEIAAAYRVMAAQAMNRNDTWSADQCLVIAEDIILLQKQGYEVDKSVAHIMLDEPDNKIA